MRGELSQIRGDYKATRNTVIGTGISVVILVVAILTLYVNALSAGATMGSSHEPAMSVAVPQSNQIAPPPTPKTLPAPVQKRLPKGRQGPSPHIRGRDVPTIDQRLLSHATPVRLGRFAAPWKIPTTPGSSRNAPSACWLSRRSAVQYFRTTSLAVAPPTVWSRSPRLLERRRAKRSRH